MDASAGTKANPCFQNLYWNGLSRHQHAGIPTQKSGSSTRNLAARWIHKPGSLKMRTRLKPDGVPWPKSIRHGARGRQRSKLFTTSTPSFQKSTNPRVHHEMGRLQQTRLARMSSGRYCLIRDLGLVKGGKGMRHHEVVMELSWRGIVQFLKSLPRSNRAAS